MCSIKYPTQASWHLFYVRFFLLLCVFSYIKYIFAKFPKTISTRITDIDTSTETTTIYPGKTHKGKKPSKENFLNIDNQKCTREYKISRPRSHALRQKTKRPKTTKQVSSSSFSSSFSSAFLRYVPKLNLREYVQMGRSTFLFIQVGCKVQGASSLRVKWALSLHVKYNGLTNTMSRHSKPLL